MDQNTREECKGAKPAMLDEHTIAPEIIAELPQ